jgi:hypothetical protein
MQSELEKRQTFAIEKEKEKYYRREEYGTEMFPISYGIAPPPPVLFYERAQKAFPSAGMDIIEAGRCLALGRNNAAI